MGKVQPAEIIFNNILAINEMFKLKRYYFDSILKDLVFKRINILQAALLPYLYNIITFLPRLLFIYLL